LLYLFDASSLPVFIFTLSASCILTICSSGCTLPFPPLPFLPLSFLLLAFPPLAFFSLPLLCDPSCYAKSLCYSYLIYRYFG
jgi:hypothetical protein